MRLQNKNIVVTGGASGIGQAAARCCAREGARGMFNCFLFLSL